MSQLERRLRNEWDLLQRLAAANPLRLTDLAAEDLIFRFRLRGAPAVALEDMAATVSVHAVRVQFPRFFPAVPMELFLDKPVLHPNIHPQSGFVCLWEKHRVGHTVATAVHKTIAMLGWRLWNSAPIHVMQPLALEAIRSGGRPEWLSLASPDLVAAETGVAHGGEGILPRRRRLS